MALALACCAGAAGAAGELDGLAFVGPTGERGKAAERSDERVEFTAGRLRSSVCEDYGFPPAAYQATREGEAVRFESVLASPRDGEIRWQGVVRAGTVEATYVWTKEGLFRTTRREYWFKGAPSGR
jgi:hypothetical protein